MKNNPMRVKSFRKLLKKQWKLAFSKTGNWRNTHIPAADLPCRGRYFYQAGYFKAAQGI